MLHLWVLLKKPTALRRQAALEALIWVHLHFQQHQGAPSARAHHRSCEAVAIELIAGGAWVEIQRIGGCGCAGQE